MPPPGREENLIKPKRDQTAEERRESARRAGIASGKARREKRKAEDKFRFAIEYFTKKLSKEARLNDNLELAEYIKETGAEVFETVQIAFDKENRSETRLKALDMINDRVHGKVKERAPEEEDEEITEPKFI